MRREPRSTHTRFAWERDISSLLPQETGSTRATTRVNVSQLHDTERHVVQTLEEVMNTQTVPRVAIRGYTRETIKQTKTELPLEAHYVQRCEAERLVRKSERALRARTR